jgi:hypothetical protein
LDAFLCVECGYCASGSFSYELTAGAATNAIAITNDRDFERATNMVSIARRLHEDMLVALKQKLDSLVQGKKKSTSSGAEGGEDTFVDSALQRAFRGELPQRLGESDDDNDYSDFTLGKLGKPGSIIKIIARPDSYSGDDRSQSLLQILRRSQSGGSASRGSSSGLMIRHLGRDYEGDDPASELLGGLLEGSGLSRLALDPTDPLSRLLASVQSRRERREAEDDRDEAQDGQAASSQPVDSSKKSKTSAKEILDECERIYALMHEAERECYELEKRCAAWRRLESGSLVDVASTSEEQHSMARFEPSHCSACAGGIAINLLQLWLQLFQLDPTSVAITREMVTLLLTDDQQHYHLRTLLETKRSAVKEIALRSEQGRPVVLEILRLRLLAVQDVNCAEILGQILEAVGDDTTAAAPFLELAQQTLESSV